MLKRKVANKTELMVCINQGSASADEWPNGFQGQGVPGFQIEERNEVGN